MQDMRGPLQLMLMLVMASAICPLVVSAAAVPEVLQSTSTAGANMTKVKMTWYANWESTDDPPFALANLSWSQYNRVSYSML